MVQYEVAKLHLLNPSLTVGDNVLSGKALGYAIPIGSGDGMHMNHWAFRKWRRHDPPFVTPEGEEFSSNLFVPCALFYGRRGNKT